MDTPTKETCLITLNYRGPLDTSMSTSSKKPVLITHNAVLQSSLKIVAGLVGTILSDYLISRLY